MINYEEVLESFITLTKDRIMDDKNPGQYFFDWRVPSLEEVYEFQQYHL